MDKSADSNTTLPLRNSHLSGLGVASKKQPQLSKPPALKGFVSTRQGAGEGTFGMRAGWENRNRTGGCPPAPGWGEKKCRKTEFILKTAVADSFITGLEKCLLLFLAFLYPTPLTTHPRTLPRNNIPTSSSAPPLILNGVFCSLQSAEHPDGLFLAHSVADMSERPS